VTGSHSWGPNTPWQPGPGGQPPTGQQPPVYGAYPPGPPVTPSVIVAQYGPQPGPGGRNRKPLSLCFREGRCQQSPPAVSRR